MIVKARRYIDELAGYGILDLGLAAILMMTVQGMLTPLLPLYFSAVGATPDKVGYISTMFFIALAIGEFCWGALSDRIGCRIPLTVATAIASLAVAGFLFTSSIPALYFFNFLRGLGISAIFPLSRGNIGASVPAKDRGTFMAAYITLQSTGRTIGTFFGGLVGNESLRLVLGIAAAILIFTSVMVYFRMKGVFIGRRRVTANSPQLADVTVVESKSDKSLAALFWLGAIIALFHLPFSLVNTFVPLRGSGFGWSVFEISLLSTISAMVSLFLTLIGGRIGDNLGWKTAMTTGMLALAVAMTAFAYAGSYLFFMGAMVLSALSSCIFRPSASARFSDLMSARRQATAMGVLGVFEDVGQIIGPSIGGILWTSSFGPQSTFLLGTVCGIGGAILNVFASKKKNAMKPVTVR
jgi:MFS family permease